MKRYRSFTQATALFTVLFLFILMNFMTVKAQVERSETPRSGEEKANIKGVILFDFPNAPEAKIEVNLTGKLIALAAKAAKAHAAEQGQDITELLDMVKGVYVRGYDSRLANLDPMLRHYENKLKKDKWEVIAKVKEENETVRVSMLLDQDIVRGLFVMVSNKDETFLVNIFGQIDFEKLGKLLANLDGLNLPSLKDIDIKADGESKEKIQDK